MSYDELWHASAWVQTAACAVAALFGSAVLVLVALLIARHWKSYDREETKGSDDAS